MRLLVTGANGFLGREVVSKAIECKHEIRAMVRPASSVNSCEWDPKSVEVIRHDLRSDFGLRDAIAGSDVVLHLAAQKTGSFYDQFATNVRGTEHLLNAMEQTKVSRLVLTSTFSVYAYQALRKGSILTEDSPLEDKLEQRDDYCRSKLIQELMVKEFADEHGLDLCIIRPGVLFGPGNLWNARLGSIIRPKLWLRIGAHANLPLTFVQNCAEAILLAAERREAIGHTINVVDDDTPTQAEYLNAMRQFLRPAPKIFPLNYSLMMAIAIFANLVNRCAFENRARLPQIFRPAALAARCKPLLYSNERAKRVLEWSPRIGFDEAMRRSTKHIKVEI